MKLWKTGRRDKAETDGQADRQSGNETLKTDVFLTRKTSGMPQFGLTWVLCCGLALVTFWFIPYSPCAVFTECQVVIEWARN